MERATIRTRRIFHLIWHSISAGKGEMCCGSFVVLCCLWHTRRRTTTFTGWWRPERRRCCTAETITQAAGGLLCVPVGLRKCKCIAVWFISFPLSNVVVVVVGCRVRGRRKKKTNHSRVWGVRKRRREKKRSVALLHPSARGGIVSKGNQMKMENQRNVKMSAGRARKRRKRLETTTATAAKVDIYTELCMCANVWCWWLFRLYERWMRDIVLCKGIHRSSSSSSSSTGNDGKHKQEKEIKESQHDVV